MIEETRNPTASNGVGGEGAPTDRLPAPSQRSIPIGDHSRPLVRFSPPLNDGLHSRAGFLGATLRLLEPNGECRITQMWELHARLMHECKPIALWQSS